MTWQIKSFTEKYAINADATIPCLLLSGWSFQCDIFEWLLPGLAQHFVVSSADLVASPLKDIDEMLVSLLAEKISKPTWLIGWSLGGNIAIELALKYPDKVLGLCLFSTTPLFLKKEDWPVGMPVDTYEKFHQGVSQDAPKTLRRFDLLQTKDDLLEKDLRSALGDYRKQQKQWSVPDLVCGLDLLVSFDQRQAIAEIKQPMLWCFGEMDSVVNVYTAQEIKALTPAAKVEVFRQTGHLPFLTATDHFFKSLLNVLHKKEMQEDKKRVANSFSHAAASYEDSAKLQEEVAAQLYQKVQSGKGILLDAGCGTGLWSAKLAEKVDSVISMDLANGMLSYGRDKYPLIQHWLQADLEELPLAEHSISHIFSSLAVQWCEGAYNYLEEWHRVLKPGGKAYIATLGPQTLSELRESWAEVDDYNHVNTFMSADKLCEQIRLSPFMLTTLRVEHKVIRYKEVKTLMQDLKNIGAQTVQENSFKGLLGKNNYLKLQNAYEKFRDDDHLLPATYEVIFICLEKYA